MREETKLCVVRWKPMSQGDKPWTRDQENPLLSAPGGATAVGASAGGAGAAVRGGAPAAALLPPAGPHLGSTPGRSQPSLRGLLAVVPTTDYLP